MIADKITLEFDKITNLLGNYAFTDLAKKALLELEPINDERKIIEDLARTDEALVLIYKLGHPSLSNIYDIYPHLKRTSLGGSLNARELREIAMHLLAVKMIKNYQISAKNEQVETKHFTAQADELTYVKDLYQRINQCIDEDSNVLDSASVTLGSIRKKITSTQSKLEDKLSSIIATQGDKFTDTLITKRNDRYVVPVKVEYKNKFKGIIQDYSASGETVFIEPQAVTELSNKIQMLRAEEKDEIARILMELSTFLGNYTEALKYNLDILIQLDVVFSKAAFAKDYQCTKPVISDEVDLIQARHPLIPQDEVVANNIFFNKYKALIITGPNTGGKTVALKTLGLMSLMTQVGMLIPVSEGSKIRVFDNIFADIGDEQSIEQSLSTFSAHMTNLIRIVDQLTTNSLVLLDELGSGTDPKEGASLAIAIIDHIKIRGCYIMATTHYTELKAYAYNEADTINASTEFNVDTLSPTYKLSIGIPGRSNAFEISRRLGLHNGIIDSAMNKLEISNTEVSQLINKLEDQTRELDKKMEHYDALNMEMDLKNQQITNEHHKLDQKIERMKHDARIEAMEVVNDARKEAQEIINDLLKMQGDVKYHTLLEKKKELSDLVPDTEQKKSSSRYDYKVNDRVKVLSYGQSAVIQKVLPKNKYEVKMGILTTTVSRQDLELVEANPKKKIKSHVTYNAKKHVKLELDLRGIRFEEAMIEVEKYIDDLVVSKRKQATIIHGHGTNALKIGVHEVLKRNKFIESYEYGKEGEGGSGVTNIFLK